MQIQQFHSSLETPSFLTSTQLLINITSMNKHKVSGEDIIPNFALKRQIATSVRSLTGLSSFFTSQAIVKTIIVTIDIITSHIEDIFSPYQFVFRKEHSTIDILNHIKPNFKNHRTTSMVSLDFSKTFDKVWHASLLKLPIPIISLIRYYLSERAFKIKCMQYLFSSKSILSEVPKASDLLHHSAIVSSTTFFNYIFRIWSNISTAGDESSKDSSRNL